MRRLRPANRRTRSRRGSCMGLSRVFGLPSGGLSRSGCRVARRVPVRRRLRLASQDAPRRLAAGSRPAGPSGHQGPCTESRPGAVAGGSGPRAAPPASGPPLAEGSRLRRCAASNRCLRTTGSTWPAPETGCSSRGRRSLTSCPRGPSRPVSPRPARPGCLPVIMLNAPRWSPLPFTAGPSAPASPCSQPGFAARALREGIGELAATAVVAPCGPHAVDRGDVVCRTPVEPELVQRRPLLRAGLLPPFPCRCLPVACAYADTGSQQRVWRGLEEDCRELPRMVSL